MGVDWLQLDLEAVSSWPLSAWQWNFGFRKRWAISRPAVCLSVPRDGLCSSSLAEVRSLHSRTVAFLSPVSSKFRLMAVLVLWMPGNLVWVVLVSISVTTQSSPQTPAVSPKQRFEHNILTRSGFVVESSAVLNYFTPEYVYCDEGKSWTRASDFYPNP